MPATPKIFSTRPNALGSLLSKARCSLFGEFRNRLTGLIDRFAPDGYEDESGFHPLVVKSSDRQSHRGGLNSLGEHI